MTSGRPKVLYSQLSKFCQVISGNRAGNVAVDLYSANHRKQQVNKHIDNVSMMVTERIFPKA